MSGPYCGPYLVMATSCRVSQQLTSDSGTLPDTR